MGGKTLPAVRISAAAFVCLAVVSAACGSERTRSKPDDQNGEPVAEAAPNAGPVLLGDSVAWGEGGVEGDGFAPIRLLLGAPTAKPRVLWEQRPSRGKPEWWFKDLEGSSKRLTFVRGWSDCEPPPYDQCVGDSEVAVAEPDGDIRSLPRHNTACGFSPGSHHVDLERDRLVFSGPYCVPQCAPPYCRPTCGPCWRIAIDDLADPKPARTLIRKFEGGDEVRTAGNFVAARSRGRAAVYDLRSGELVYQARLPDFSKIDLQADGKMVAVWLVRDGRGLRSGAAWFSPDEPWKHALPIRPVLYHEYEEHPQRVLVRLAGDRVAFESELSPGKSALVVAGLDGKVVQRVASFDEKEARVGDFDFDGERVTWATREVRHVRKECWTISSRGHSACQDYYEGPTTIYVAHLS
jgi:hypothetical protein